MPVGSYETLLDTIPSLDHPVPGGVRVSSAGVRGDGGYHNAGGARVARQGHWAALGGPETLAAPGTPSRQHQAGHAVLGTACTSHRPQCSYLIPIYARN